MRVLTAYRFSNDGNLKTPIYGYGPWWVVLAHKVGSWAMWLYVWADRRLIEDEADDNWPTLQDALKAFDKPPSSDAVDPQASSTGKPSTRV